MKDGKCFWARLCVFFPPFFFKKKQKTKFTLLSHPFSPLCPIHLYCPSGDPSHRSSVGSWRVMCAGADDNIGTVCGAWVCAQYALGARNSKRGKRKNNEKFASLLFSLLSPSLFISHFPSCSMLLFNVITVITLLFLFFILGRSRDLLENKQANKQLGVTEWVVEIYPKRVALRKDM
uniref:Uncharacterized protein TCIL3000_4_3040 n=1 Tax=Trypanosoma congolense (strain IL3000) TaxID=1068625 RepID=G0ULF6_TRYCI|nr:unnamed protein product [Trypanosoma congolense IL3000]